jgi:formylmethanofuran dehydrogenase subunit C
LARENIDLPSTTLHTAGIFISYVVNEKYLRNEVELKINHPIDYLGLYTKKNWIIKGNVGNSLGRGMKGGKIKVEGDALTHVGEEMEDGVIEIDGDVSYYVGAGMKGGSIYLNGDFEGISASASGEIYHRGRRLGE